MKRFRFPWLLDVVLSEDAEEIEALAGDALLDRAYANRSLPLNALVLARIRRILQVGGQPLPTVAARETPGRAASQNALWNRLNVKAQHFREGPDELECLAAFVRGESSPATCGPLVQEIVGRLFAPDFQATSASWEAALVLDKAPRTVNPALLAWWAVTGRVDRAKRLLSGMVGGDLAGVHAVGIALHNIVSGVTLMRELFSDPQARGTLSPEAAGSRCLFAPDAVLRQPTAQVSLPAAELSAQTLVVLKLQAGNAHAPSGELAFLRESWSRCPAEQWVPALLAGIWRRACRLPPGDDRAGAAASCPFPRA